VFSSCAARQPLVENYVLHRPTLSLTADPVTSVFIDFADICGKTHEFDAIDKQSFQLVKASHFLYPFPAGAHGASKCKSIATSELFLNQWTGDIEDLMLEFEGNKITLLAHEFRQTLSTDIEDLALPFELATGRSGASATKQTMVTGLTKAFDRALKVSRNYLANGHGTEDGCGRIP
jgi:hypothetical protein